MHAGRSIAPRLWLITLAVVALHVLLLAGAADRMAALVAPPAAPSANTVARQANAVAVRAVEHAAAAVQAQESAAPTQESAAPTQESAAPAARLAPAQHAAARGAARVRPARAPQASSAGARIAPPPAVAAAPAPAAAAARQPAAVEAVVYATRIPDAFAFAYALQRGADGGEVELRWQPEGEHYVASLEGRGGDRSLIAWRSSGGFDRAGIAPQRFVDQRRGRAALAVNLQRDAGKITYSGPQAEHPLAPGTQDRLSWMLQLAAIAAANPDRAAAPGGVALVVAGVRGEADVWRFEPIGGEAIAVDGDAVETLRLLRRPARPYDTRAEVWLAPSLGYLPLRVRLSNGGDELQLQWRGALPPR